MAKRLHPGRRDALARRQSKEDDRAGAALVTDDWGRIASLFHPLRISPEQLRAFPRAPGSDEEPWDVMLQILALDEQTALERLAERTGLPYLAEPRLEASAARFYELVPADDARARHVAGVECGSEEGQPVMVVATAQPMQPATFNLLESLLDMPVRIVLAPRGAVANLINRGYEQRDDLVTEIIDEMPLDGPLLHCAASDGRERPARPRPTETKSSAWSA